jgi:activator of HSP90 ATPase
VSESLNVFSIFPVPSKRIYEAWLDSKEHSAFTNSEAIIDPRVGGEFSTWEGYITGKTISLEPFTRIIQSWRTTDFNEDDPDSRLEVTFEAMDSGCKVTLKQTGLPDGSKNEYIQGWEDYYFAPMQEYFVK